MGHRETLESTDLIVWIELQTVEKVRLALAPADRLSSGNTEAANQAQIGE